MGVYWVHDQGGLDAHRRAVAAVDALDLARDQAVGDVIDAGAAIALDRRAQDTEFAAFVHDFPVEPLVAVGLQERPTHLLLPILPRKVPDQPTGTPSGKER